MNRSPWFFVTIGAILMLLSLLATYVVWAQIQTALESSESAGTNTTLDANSFNKTTSPENNLDTDDISNGAETNQVVSDTETMEEYAPVRAADLPLSSSQIETAASFGIDIESFVITADMQKCMVAKVGDGRYDAILAGAQPGFLEMTKLFGCLNQ